MTPSLLKNTFREIKNTKARFISILAIIALGVGFFAGIKATVPSMYALAEEYYDSQNLMDFRLVSTVGFDSEDIKAVENTYGVTSVMPSYFCDVISSSSKDSSVVRVIALPGGGKDRELNKIVLRDGRLPEKDDEILVEASSMMGKKYKIGDKVSFEAAAGDNDVRNQLKVLNFTVVGKADSPLYISYPRGTTTVGSGKLSEFMYVSESTFAFERYTQLYVKADFSDKYSPFSDEYAEQSEAVGRLLEDTSNARCEAFIEENITTAKNKLDEAKRTLDDEKKKAEKELSEAEKKLKDGKSEYEQKTADAQNKLDSARNEIDSGYTKLESSKSQYDSQISSAEQLFSQKQEELKKGQAEYENSKSEFDKKIAQAEAQLDSKTEEYEAAYNKFKSEQEPLILFGIEQAQKTVDFLNEKISSQTNPNIISILKVQLEYAEKTLNIVKDKYDSALKELDSAKAQLDSARAKLDAEKAKGEAQLADAKKKLEQGEAALESGRAELTDRKIEGQVGIADAQSRLSSAQSQYESGVSELEAQKESGKAELEKAQKQYDDGKTQADEKFAQAQNQIEEAEKKLSGVIEPKWYVFDRNDNPDYANFSQNVDRLSAVASVFPIFFLLVAVLVCVTTMTRLVEEMRTEIGTLKALGYSNISIIAKFAVYSLTAAIIGCVLGTAIGVSTLPFIIFNAYKIMYYIGDISLVLDVPSIVLGVTAAVVCTTAVSVTVCAMSLSKKPAQAMRPKAPKAGKRIFLERITPLWKHMSFTAKLTARNLFRYKVRMCMTVIGVAGCTALIVAAFGLLDSFNPITEVQFGDIYKYDAVVIPKSSGTQSQLEYLSEINEKYSGVNESMLVLQEEAQIQTDRVKKDDGIYLTVLQNPDRIDNMISFRERISGKKLTLSDSGVLINEKLAEEMSLAVGDCFEISSDSGKAEVKVCGIYEQYINNYIYMSPKLYSSLFGCEPMYNMVNLCLDNTSDSFQTKLGEQLLDDERIVAVSFVNESIDTFKNMLKSLNLVVVVMIICAAALAFVVLYNLTNINIAERVREIATFKVLGFKNRETSSFIYKENIALTLIGIAVGLILGIFLTGFIVRTVEVNNVMFGRTIFAQSYLYAAGFTMFFSLLVNAVMSFKIRAVNMVESLKSVE